MTKHQTRSVISRVQGGVSALLRVVGGVVFFGLLTASPALAGDSYSATWVNDSESGPSVWGCGVTINDSGGYTHSAAVYTTITSPNGRSTSAGWGSASGYARVDVSLPWDWGDMGDYYVESSHNGYCPHYGGSSFAPSTFTKVTVGYSKICYAWDHYDPNFINPNVYRIVPGCGDRISCWNTYFYSLYHVGMRGKSAQGYTKAFGDSLKVCTYVQQPIISGACDYDYCQDVDVANVPFP